MMRLFFAVDIPSNARFIELYSDLDRISRELRPVHPSNQHVTLKFLGDPDRPLDDVKGAPKELASEFLPFELTLLGSGAFPNWDRPSVLWLGLEPADRIKDLAERLDVLLNSKIGSGLEKRRFRSHMTVARIKGRGPVHVPGAREAMERALDGLRNDHFTIPVKEFGLISSTLTPQGPIYRTIETYPLKG